MQHLLFQKADAKPKGSAGGCASGGRTRRRITTTVAPVSPTAAPVGGATPGVIDLRAAARSLPPLQTCRRHPSLTRFAARAC